MCHSQVQNIDWQCQKYRLAMSKTQAGNVNDDTAQDFSSHHIGAFLQVSQQIRTKFGRKFWQRARPAFVCPVNFANRFLGRSSSITFDNLRQLRCCMEIGDSLVRDGQYRAMMRNIKKLAEVFATYHELRNIQCFRLELVGEMGWAETINEMVSRQPESRDFVSLWAQFR
jgi:hypothetical protein